MHALTKGIRRDGAHLFPAMPYPYYTKVTRDDVLAIRAYLATVPAVNNAVHADQLQFPIKIRANMAAWNKLLFTPGEFRPVHRARTTRGTAVPTWPKGSCIAAPAIHLKTSPARIRTMSSFRAWPLQGWFAPDITTDGRRGLGFWSIDDIAVYLKTGHNRFAAATGPMADEVADSSSKMTDADLRAVATWFKDQPAPREDNPPSAAASDPMMRTGAAIYADECAACHTPRGTGIPGLFSGVGRRARRAIRRSDIRDTGGPWRAREASRRAAMHRPRRPCRVFCLGCFNDRQTAAGCARISATPGEIAASSVTPVAEVSRETPLKRFGEGRMTAFPVGNPCPSVLSE